jgi:hypothetical protein
MTLNLMQNLLMVVDKLKNKFQMVTLLQATKTAGAIANQIVPPVSCFIS